MHAAPAGSRVREIHNREVPYPAAGARQGPAGRGKTVMGRRGRRRGHNCPVPVTESTRDIFKCFSWGPHSASRVSPSNSRSSYCESMTRRSRPSGDAASQQAAPPVGGRFSMLHAAALFSGISVFPRGAGPAASGPALGPARTSLARRPGCSQLSAVIRFIETEHPVRGPAK
jgi:hypothetical protein